MSDVDFVPLSENISVPAGDTRDCIIIFTLRDEECEYSECSYEHFLCNLTTLNYHVNLEPSQTTIFIEEDLISQNCSELNNWVGAFVVFMYMVQPPIVD